MSVYLSTDVSIYLYVYIYIYSEIGLNSCQSHFEVDFRYMILWQC